MVKRISLQRYGFIVFALIVMMMIWEANRSSAAIWDGDIPQDAIRIRILANSDSLQDQASKRVIRDVITAEMSQWIGQPETIEEARAYITAHLPVLDELVGQTMQQMGMPYSYKIELATVPFPAKVFNNRTYPAGSYEALRVTIGEGKGENWWCVLFPPLCFVDAVVATEAPVKGSKSKSKLPAVSKQASAVNSMYGTETSETSDTSSDTSGVSKNVISDTANDHAYEQEELSSLEEDVPQAMTEVKQEVRFFLWDLISGWF